MLHLHSVSKVRLYPGPCLGDLEHLDTSLLLPHLHEQESSRHALNKSPLPDGLRVRTSKMAEIGTSLTAKSHIRNSRPHLIHTF